MPQNEQQGSPVSDDTVIVEKKTIEWCLSAAKVLKDICEKAGLTGGQESAEGLINHLSKLKIPSNVDSNYELFMNEKKFKHLSPFTKEQIFDWFKVQDKKFWAVAHAWEYDVEREKQQCNPVSDGARWVLDLKQKRFYFIHECDQTMLEQFPDRYIPVQTIQHSNSVWVEKAFNDARKFVEHGKMVGNAREYEDFEEWKRRTGYVESPSTEYVDSKEHNDLLAAFNNLDDKNEKLEQEIQRLKEERDNFAISYCAWYCHSEDAELYRQQRLSAGKILSLYKDRPFIKHDNPEEN